MSRLYSRLKPPAAVKSTMLHDSVTTVILRQTPQLSDMHRKVGMP